MKANSDQLDNSQLVIVMVTYGNRYQILKKTISHLVNEDDLSIVLVENDISAETKSFLDRTIGTKLHRIQLNYNSGSAGGYSAGLAYALDKFPTTNKFLLLDDDNFLSKKFLSVLKPKISALDFASCSRISRNKLTSKRCSENNFMGTNLFNRNKGTIRCAPYGGLLVSRRLLMDVGLPNRKLYLYGDDHEFTLRASIFGEKLILLNDIQIEDIDESHDRKSEVHRYFQENFDIDKLYFQIRNHSYLSYLTKKSALIFYCNLVFVLLILFGNNIKTMHFPMKRWKIIIKGILDGKSFKP